MEGFGVADGEFGVLGVEGLDVGFGNLGVRHVLPVEVFRREDGHLHAFALLREEVQHLRRRPVVNENQRLLRARNQLQHQRPRVPNLPIVEDALKRRRPGLHEEIDLVLQFGDVAFMFCKSSVHLVFQLRQPGIDRVAFQKIGLEYLRRPSAKHGRVATVDAVAHGQDGVKVVEHGAIRLFAVMPHVFQNGTCALPLQFAALVYVDEMLGYRRSLRSEKVGNLFLRQPHGLVFEPHVQPDGFVRLVDDNLVLVRGHSASTASMPLNCSTRFFTACSIRRPIIAKRGGRVQ